MLPFNYKMFRKVYKLTVLVILIIFLSVYLFNRISNNKVALQYEHKDIGNPNKNIQIIVGGDVNFDLKIRKPRVIISDYPRSTLEKIKNKIYYGRKKIVGARFPEILLGKWMSDDYSWWEKESWISFDLTFSDKWQEAEYPFNKIKNLLSDADISFINLETPLAIEDKSRAIGYFISKPIFAYSLKNAGVDIVSVANNHAWDAGEKGFLQTLQNLQQANVKIIGGGRNINEARKPEIFNINGTKIGFIAYSQQFKYKFISVADDNNPGIAPFNLKMISSDIKSAKKFSDLVFVSLHWGLENTSEIHPQAINFARKIIDAGADAIIGHHAHIPKGIEIYKDKPIIYSLGNFIFGHNTKWWDDNVLVKILVCDKKIAGLEIIPITGRGVKLYQPEILVGPRALTLLNKIKKASYELNTNIEVHNFKGLVKIKH